MSNYILAGVFILGYVCGEDMIGTGTWSINHLSYLIGKGKDIVIDLQQKMLNRTHYVYNGKIEALIPLDDDLGIKMDVCIMVDGGCKQYALLTDKSFKNFANKFAEKNINECMEKMGCKPAHLPMDKGVYEVKDFMFDVNELPKNFTFGIFKSEICAISLTLGIPVGCLLAEYEFSKMKSDSSEEE